MPISRTSMVDLAILHCILMKIKRRAGLNGMPVIQEAETGGL
jgi:hypothetical protein